MSNYNYHDYYLTYFLPRLDGSPGLFDDEMQQVISRAIAPTCTAVKVAMTQTMSEVQGSENTNLKWARMRFYGVYCVFVFENDEDRHMFKLAIPNDAELAVLVQHVINILD